MEQKKSLTSGIAASYLGAGIHNSRLPDMHFRLFGVMGDGHIRCKTADDKLIWLHTADSQLIITSLSKISDLDAIEVASIALTANGVNCSIDELKVISRHIDHIEIGYDSEVIAFILRFDGALFFYDNEIVREDAADCVIPVSRQLPCFDFLRAIYWNGRKKEQYDLGHAEIKSLILAGIAIEK